MMKDIESLSQIDYPKMLKLNVQFDTTQIFKYEPNLKSQADHQESEIQELLGQLRKSVEVFLDKYLREKFNLGT